MPLSFISIDPAKLRAARRSKKLSQEALAALAGLAKRTVERIEQGKPLTETTLKDIASALNLGPSELLPSHLNSDLIAPSRLPHSCSLLFGRDAELRQLDSAWADPNLRVVTLIGWGGTGKTSLSAKWAALCARRNYDGARYFDWSFYSQGFTEATATAEHFLHAALSFFGDLEMANSAAAPWDKGARLAELIRAKRTLLVLDGLEPLQHPPGPKEGFLKSPALSSLLRGLSQQNPGLCVITSRARLGDLISFSSGTVKEIFLQGISDSAGIELLRSMGVYGSEEDLAALVHDVNGHPLTLSLTGAYLAMAHHGDISRRHRIRFEEADLHVQGGHAFRVMSAYEKWLLSSGKTGLRQFAAIRLLGLFDHPVKTECLNLLRSKPGIPGLTDALSELTDSEWNLILANLTQAGLLTVHQSEVDAHPLVREYFARQLEKASRTSIQQAHQRIASFYDRFQSGSRHTAEVVLLLSNAIRHRCLAGDVSSAWKSFERGWLQKKSFAKALVGEDARAAASLTLSLTRGFFDECWQKVSRQLTTEQEAKVLGEAGHNLFILGRYDEARDLLFKAVGVESELQTTESQSRASGWLGIIREMYLVQGNFSEAFVCAKRAIELAELSRNLRNRVLNQAALGQVLHYQGKWEKAFEAFYEAENLYESSNPNKKLFGVAAFWYLQFLIECHQQNLSHLKKPLTRVQSDPEGILKRAQGLLQIAQRHQRRMDMGHAYMLLGKATYAFRKDSLKQAILYFDNAVSNLRLTGQQHHLVECLLARANCRINSGEPDHAKHDLLEAWEIVERSPMRIIAAEIALERSRIEKDESLRHVALQTFYDCKYGRRTGTLIRGEDDVTHSIDQGAQTNPHPSCRNRQPAEELDRAHTEHSETVLQTIEPTRSRPKVFLSYSWANADVVRAINQWLRNNKVETVIDHLDFSAGERLFDQIIKRMSKCEVVLVFYSEAAQKGPWVSFERSLAKDIQMDARIRRKRAPRIIYFVLDDARLPDVVERNRLAIRAKGRRFEESCKELYRALVEQPHDSKIDLKDWLDRVI